MGSPRQIDHPVRGLNRALGAASSLVLAAGLWSAPNAAAQNTRPTESPDQSETAESDTQSESKSDQIVGPGAVTSQIEENADTTTGALDTDLLERLQDARDRFADRTGLHLGADYNAIYYLATDSLGKNNAGAGAFRLYGKWDLVGRGTSDLGSLVFKQEHRHAYTAVPPASFAPELGYAGLVDQTHSDQRWRTTNLYWRQSLLDGGFITFLGFIDTTDYADIYPLANPWTTFSNLVFGSGSGTMGGQPDGALGAMAGIWLTDNVYAVAGIADANADPTSVFDGFETFFDDFETFKSLEFGWTPDRDKLAVDNAHITLWQLDERDDAGLPDGWGVNLSISSQLDEQWLGFLRAGWAEDGGSSLEASISGGFAYQPEPGGDMLGVGLNWGRPNSDTYGSGLDDQFTGEIFYRIQVTKNTQITPSVQLLGNPALNPEDDFIALVGVRLRTTF